MEVSASGAHYLTLCVREGAGLPILLKIFLYGYLNRIQSGRRLERETQRDIELTWLTGRLMPDAMTIRRQTVEHPFGTLEAWMGGTHFLTRTLERVKTEVSPQVPAYNMKRMIDIVGVKPLPASSARQVDFRPIIGIYSINSFYVLKGACVPCPPPRP